MRSYPGDPSLQPNRSLHDGLTEGFQSVMTAVSLVCSIGPRLVVEKNRKKKKRKRRGGRGERKKWKKGFNRVSRFPL